MAGTSAPCIGDSSVSELTSDLVMDLAIANFLIVTIGIGLATCGWVHSNNRNRILQRKQIAIKFIHDHNFDPHWTEATKALFNKFIDEPSFRWDSLVEKRYGRHQTLSDEEKTLFRHLMCVLNYLEIAAVAVLNGAADEDILRETQRSVFVNAHSKLSPFITKLRSDTNFKSAYINFETLAKRWAPPQPTSAQHKP